MAANELVRVWENPQDSYWEIVDEYTPRDADTFEVSKRELVENNRAVSTAIIMESRMDL